MYPHEDGLVGGHVTHHERQVRLAVEHALERVAAELAPHRRQPSVGHLGDELLVTTAVAHEVGDRHEDEPVLVGELAQVSAAGHLATVEDQLAQHAGRSPPCEPGQIDRGLRVPDPLQHTARPRPQGEDVTRTVERSGAHVAVGQGAQVSPPGPTRRSPW